MRPICLSGEATPFRQIDNRRIVYQCATLENQEFLQLTATPTYYLNM